MQGRHKEKNHVGLTTYVTESCLTYYIKAKIQVGQMDCLSYIWWHPKYDTYFCFNLIIGTYNPKKSKNKLGTYLPLIYLSMIPNFLI